MLALTIISTTAAVVFAQNYGAILTWWKGQPPLSVPLDETIVVAMCVGVLIAFVAAVANKLTGWGLLSRMAERVTFVLIPPLLLIFLVLGTIFLGIATPTEGGAMGAIGALVMAVARGRLSFSLLKQALNTTVKLSCFVVFILIGSTIFSLVFQGVDGPKWVEHLLTGLPGGQVGFLIVVNILIFVLAFFLDFFELSFIVVPLLGPVAIKLGIDPVNDVQVLTPMHRGASGTLAMNEALQGMLNPTGPTVKMGARTFRLGDKVMQLRNDYEREVYNGDIGWISSLSEEDRTLSVKFDDRLVASLLTRVRVDAQGDGSTVRCRGSRYQVQGQGAAIRKALRASRKLPSVPITSAAGLQPGSRHRGSEYGRTYPRGYLDTR